MIVILFICFFSVYFISFFCLLGIYWYKNNCNIFKSFSIIFKSVVLSTSIHQANWTAKGKNQINKIKERIIQVKKRLNLHTFEKDLVCNNILISQLNWKRKTILNMLIRNVPIHLGCVLFLISNVHYSKYFIVA